jgi:DnaK suppressor protein
MSKKSSHLDKKQFNELKDQMLSEKQRIINELTLNPSEFAVDGEERLDEVDKASIDQSTDEILRFRNRDLLYLKKINFALEKMDKGTYGLCEECDCEIKFERLMARPVAEMCISCKEEAERDESFSYSGKKSKSLGETLVALRTV